MWKDTRNKQSGRILGIDYGSRRIGIAISDPTRTIARSLTVIENNGEIFRRISEICNRYEIEFIVVGLPLTMKGGLSSKTREVIKFIEKLREKLKIKVIHWDERLTTVIANRSKLNMGLRKKRRMDKGLNDAIASTLILQSYLEYLKNTRINH